jgi:hypothetical protein
MARKFEPTVCPCPAPPYISRTSEHFPHFYPCPHFLVNALFIFSAEIEGNMKKTALTALGTQYKNANKNDKYCNSSHELHKHVK